ncbi:unnamed protein product [Arctia plantaginis]|uniref:Uncharacterized protein n=1 Tax=Arctia plantaginis TaxID=874455 RepID=A0A8S0YNJ4_ARCPL|nr:unnamed protein product [Arctia plantaginis]
MVDNLPLIPDKGPPCTDVRSVLRTVFRELNYLPPLTVQSSPQGKTELGGEHGDQSLPSVDHWVDKYKSECNKISNHEDEIKDHRAKQVARKPLPNVFKLHERGVHKHLPKCSLDGGLVCRKDLKPEVEQNAGRDGSLWVKNILNVSSCDVSTVTVNTKRRAPAEIKLCPETSVLSFSVGPHVMHTAASVVRSTPETVTHINYILCVPPKLDFINSFVGNLYAKNIRLVNMTKFECRLSIIPPKHREFDVEIRSPRGLTITSGATVELIVRFKPSDVRVLKDELIVKVSRGQTCTIPIACYMQPPLLDIVVPTVNRAVDQTPLGSSSKDDDCKLDVVELGARLLGDVHCSRVLLYCKAKHAEFFVLTEDAWVDWDLDCLTTRCSVIADSFVFWPAWWRGGGLVKACVWCCGDSVGAFGTELRVLSSTAINRQLSLLADVMLFNPHHLVIEAHEKDFDICSESDPGCEYYVNMGTALQHRSLSATVRLVNNSPILYSYYWEVRRWGVCFCWEEERESQGLDEESEFLCTGARESKRMAGEDPEAYAQKNKAEHMVVVGPGEDQILPRTSCTLRVSVPDVGEEVGLQRSVLRLILKDIPKESFPANYKPMILHTKEVASVPIPGLQSSKREVCDVVCAEMEVWWRVVPLRFVLDPPVVPLYHSRRQKSVEVTVTACKLFGWDKSRVMYVTPKRVSAPEPMLLSTARCLTNYFTVPLPSMQNQSPETDVLALVADNDEWTAECVITRRCETRHPALQPGNVWLGVVPPKTKLRAAFLIKNDTYQRNWFWCEAFRWIGENNPRPACVGQIPCRDCKEIACTCAIVRPSRGALDHGGAANIFYNVNAPERDGCVATLLRARRCQPDLSMVHSGPATEARAALVAYRVLAPRVTIRVQPCGGTSAECGECEVDAGALASELGSSTLRPSKALVVGRRTCYRLRVTNITPLPTSVHFDKLIDGTDFLKVTFTPNDFSLSGYAKVNVTVVLAARRVCERRMFVCRAIVLRAYQPLYLIIDAAISGVQVSLQVPVGEGAVTDDFVIMRRTQRNGSEEKKGHVSTPSGIFAEEDRKRAVIKANVCKCHFELQYIPPVKRPRPPPQREEDYPPIEIVTEPPMLTRVCPCFPHCKPFIPDAPESISLEYINMPLRKVCKRRLLLRNESIVTAHWTAAIRRWPRRHKRTIETDQWAGDVCESGVALSCHPTSGVLASCAHVEIIVQVYADCWGVYRDQILIQVENVDPIVVDIWMQVIGSPLQFKIQPNYSQDELPIMWLSPTDARRSLVVRNISRSELTVQAYVTRENEREQDVLPFRLYMRMYDILPVTCPCVTAFDSVSKTSSTTSYVSSDMDTGVEVYLAPDHGPQDDTFYSVMPEECSIKPDECITWDVVLDPPPSPETAPDTTLMLRLKPHKKAGDNWYRDEPQPQLVQLRQVARLSRLKLSCDEIVVKICALDLPLGNFLRIRKRFRVLNVGNGMLTLRLQTCVPWCIVQSCESDNQKSKKICNDVENKALKRNEAVTWDLPPTSSTEVCVEVCVTTVEAWPTSMVSTCSPFSYAPRRRETTPLYLYEDFLLLQTLPLTVDVEYPVIKVEPCSLDFGFVTDGDSKKTYISVSHTSPTATLALVVQRDGCEEFVFWPSILQVAPGCSERIYIQYTAVWRHGPAECCITVQECSAAGGWCRGAVALRASPALDHKWRAEVHDHTDDEHLLPARVQLYLP